MARIGFAGITYGLPVIRAQYQKQVKYEVWKRDHPGVSDVLVENISCHELGHI
jgi:hypothetical protein